MKFIRGVMFCALLLVCAAAFATTPTKDSHALTPTTTLATSTDVDLDEVSVGLGLGAGSADYTGDCVVPKKGRNGKTGFLERGWTLILLRVDPAVEVDEICVARAREREDRAIALAERQADNEALRLENERQRLANDRLLLELRLAELVSK